MVLQTYNYIVAIDATNNDEECTRDPVVIPKPLRKLIDKGAEDLGLKVLILHDSETLPTQFFKQSFLTKRGEYIDLNTNPADFWFKLGLGLGGWVHTLLYTFRKDNYDKRFHDNWKFVLKGDTTCFSNYVDPNVGKLEVKSIEDLEKFDFSWLKKAEDDYFKSWFPEMIEMEEQPNFESILQEIWGKIAKQFNNINSIDISKFSNTCNNLIKQHLASSKTKVCDQSLYRTYMLSTIFDELSSNQIIRSKGIDILLESHVYRDKELLNSLNVEIDQSLLQEKYGSERLKLTNELRSIASTSTKDTSEWGKKPDPYSKYAGVEETKYIGSSKESSRESTQASSSISTSGSSLLELSSMAIDEEDLSDMKHYIIASFLRKYEQANYENIKKSSKFVNAVSNFIAQTFESKKFKSKFRDIAEMDIKDSVSWELIRASLALHSMFLGNKYFSNFSNLATL